MIKYFLSLSLCFPFLFSFAQKNTYNAVPDNTFWSIKISPLSLFEPDQAISLATEIKPIPRLSIQVEGGYIFNTVYLSTRRTITNTQGFRIVPEIRYYDIHFKKNLQRYLGLQLSYKQLGKDVEEWVYKSNYQQLETVHLKKNNMTFTLIAGLQNHAKLIGYDFNLGLGMKYKTLYNYPDRNNLDTIFESYLGETISGYYPQLSASFKLCIRIL